MSDNKIFLTDMSEDQLARIFNACQAVREGMLSYSIDLQRDIVFGELNYFNETIDATEDAWNNLGIRVNDPVGFLEKLNGADSWRYGSIDQKTRDLYAELLSKKLDYIDASASDDDEEAFAFCSWYIDRVDRVAYALRSYYQDILDEAYDDTFIRELFVNCASDGVTVTIGTTDAEASEFYIIGDDYGTLYRDTVTAYR